MQPCRGELAFALLLISPDFIFYKLKNLKNHEFHFFASLKNLKKYEFHFLQA